jgi:hypothetical protein
MVDHARKGLVVRGLLMRDLVVKDTIERKLIAKGGTESSPSTMSLVTASVIRRWKIKRKSMPTFSVKWMGKTQNHRHGRY